MAIAVLRAQGGFLHVRGSHCWGAVNADIAGAAAPPT
jgi:hypothetical protein